MQMTEVDVVQFRDLMHRCGHGRGQSGDEMVEGKSVDIS